MSNRNKLWEIEANIGWGGNGLRPAASRMPTAPLATKPTPAPTAASKTPVTAGPLNISASYDPEVELQQEREAATNFAREAGFGEVSSSRTQLAATSTFEPRTRFDAVSNEIKPVSIDPQTVETPKNAADKYVDSRVAVKSAELAVQAAERAYTEFFEKNKNAWSDKHQQEADRLYGNYTSAVNAFNDTLGEYNYDYDVRSYYKDADFYNVTKTIEQLDRQLETMPAGEERDRVQAHRDALYNSRYDFATRNELSTQYDLLGAQNAKNSAAYVELDAAREAYNDLVARRGRGETVFQSEIDAALARLNAAQEAVDGIRSDRDALGVIIAQRDTEDILKDVEGTTTGELVDAFLRYEFNGELDLSGFGFSQYEDEIARAPESFFKKSIVGALEAQGYTSEQAANFVETIIRQANAAEVWGTEERKGMMAKLDEFAGKSGWAAAALSLMSVGTNLTSGMGLLAPIETLLSDSTYTNADPNSKWLRGQQLTQGARDAVMKQYNAPVQLLGKEVDLFDESYGILMSTADSLTAVAVGGGSAWAGATLLGLSAASSTVADVTARGGTAGQALGLGLLAGSFETLFEKVSLGNLQAMKEADWKGIKNITSNFGKTFLVNGSEEFFTEAANVVADWCTMGNLSNAALSIQQYMADGMSEHDAKVQTAIDTARQLGSAGLTGAIQGLFMAGTALATNAVTNSVKTNKTVADYKLTSKEHSLQVSNILNGIEYRNGSETHATAVALRNELNAVIESGDRAAVAEFFTENEARFDQLAESMVREAETAAPANYTVQMHETITANEGNVHVLTEAEATVRTVQERVEMSSAETAATTELLTDIADGNVSALSADLRSAAKYLNSSKLKQAVREVAGVEITGSSNAELRREYTRAAEQVAERRNVATAESVNAEAALAESSEAGAAFADTQINNPAATAMPVGGEISVSPVSPVQVVENAAAGAGLTADFGATAMPATGKAGKGSDVVLTVSGEQFTRDDVAEMVRYLGYDNAAVESVLETIRQMNEKGGAIPAGSLGDAIRFAVAEMENRGVTLGALTEEQWISQELYRIMLEPFGVDVKVVTGADAYILGGANGMFADGVLYVNGDSADVDATSMEGIAWIIGHELTHAVKAAQGESGAIVDSIERAMRELAEAKVINGVYAEAALNSEKMDALRAQTRQRYVNFYAREVRDQAGKVLSAKAAREQAEQMVTDELIREEIAADFIGTLLGLNPTASSRGRVGSRLGRENLLVRLAEVESGKVLREAHATLGEMFKVHRRSGIQLKQVREAMQTQQRVMGELLSEFTESLKKAENATPKGDVKMAVNEHYAPDIDEWNREGRPAGEVFQLGTTGSVLQGLGAVESDLLIRGDKIEDILTGTEIDEATGETKLKHPEMSIETIKQLPQILEDPVLVLVAKSEKAKNDPQNVNAAAGAYSRRIVVFGDVKAQGKPVMAVLDLRPHEKRALLDDMQFVSSAYVKTKNPAHFIRTSYILYADKKRATSLLRGVGFHTPIALQRSGFLGSITYKGPAVKLFGAKFSDVFSEQKARPGKRFSAPESEGVRTPAPTFYSFMGKVVEGVKQEKLGAASVIPMLRGKGVKQEEIKWSGIAAFLDGKKSVTKAELLEFIRGSMLDVEIVNLGEHEATPAVYGPRESSWSGAIIESWEEFVEEAELAAANAGVDTDALHFVTHNYPDTSVWEAYVYDGDDFGRAIITAEAEVFNAADSSEDNTRWRDYTEGEAKNYQEILFKLPGSSYSNDAMRTHWGEGGVLAHARVDDQRTVDGDRVLFIEEIQSDWHNAGAQKGYLSKEDMALWEEFDELSVSYLETDEERARLRELNARFNPTAAAIAARNEEVNARLDTEAFASIRDKLVEVGAASEVGYAKNVIITNRSFEEFVMYLVGRQKMPHFTEAEIESLSDYYHDRDNVTNEFIDYARGPRDTSDPVPDAPFAKTYHEYVLKNLLRVAAEEGYDYLGWTTGVMQEERWSSEYAEGYHIEYDQDIPKFLNKYGKQWGAKVFKQKLRDVYDAEYVEEQIAKLERDRAEWEETLEQTLTSKYEVRDAIWGGRLDDGRAKFLEIISPSSDAFSDPDITAVLEWDERHQGYIDTATGQIFEDKADALEWTAFAYAGGRGYGQDFIQRQIDYCNSEIAELKSRGEIWTIPITKAMKDSVIYEGQPLYSAPERARPVDGAEVAGYNKRSENAARRGKTREYSGRYVEWAVESGVLTEEERIAFFHRIADIAKLGDKVRRTSDGGYIVDLGNKLLFTDGDWHAPSLSSVIILNDTSETSMRVAKDVIFNGRHNKTGYEESRQTIERAYWPGYVERFTAQNSRTYGGENARAEGTDSGGDNERAGHRVDPSFSAPENVAEPASTEAGENVPAAAETAEERRNQLLREAVMRIMGYSAEELTGATERRNADDGLGAADAGFAGETFDYQDWVEQSEDFHPVSGEQANNPQRERAAERVPRENKFGRLTSKHAQTLINSGVTPDAMAESLKSALANGAFSHIAYTDKRALKQARATIERLGWDAALAKYEGEVAEGKVSKENTVLGIELYNEAVTNGDFYTALDLVSRMTENATSAAQAVQAHRILNKLTPEGRLYGAIRSIANLEQELLSRYGDRAPELELDSALLEEYRDALIAGDNAAINKAWGAIEQNIADQLPANAWEKLNAWRYLSMLGNFRTHIRNIVGNVGFMPARLMKQAIRAGLERVALGEAGQGSKRTTAVLNPASADDRALLQAAWIDFTEVEGIVLSGGKYVDTNSEIEEKRTIYKFKPLEIARKTNGNLLEVEDKVFSRLAYSEALASYLKAQGVDAGDYLSGGITEELRNNAQAYAISEAEKATYRDLNQFSSLVSKIGKMGKRADAGVVAKAAGVIVEGVLPFKKTPANILARAVEYSPVEFGVVLASDLRKVKKGDMQVSEMLDHISSGLTGTAIVGLGCLFARLGWVVGGGDDDEKVQAFNELRGMQEYAMIIGDKNYTLDWLAPAALPFFVGVEIFNALSAKREEGEDFFPELINSLANIGEPILNMSMLSSVNDLISNVSYAAENQQLWGIMSGAVVSYLQQFLPTLFGQIERVTESERESTFVDRNSGLSANAQYNIGKALNKLPFDFQQVPYIDAWGRHESSGNVLQRIGNNMFNPAYVGVDASTPNDEELLRLYEQGYTDVLPTRPKQSTKVDGEYLTEEEYLRYATIRGQRSLELVTDLLKSDVYKDMSDKAKADAIADAYEHAKDEATNAVLEMRGLEASADTKDFDAAVAAGMDEALYFAVQSAVSAAPIPEGYKTQPAWNKNLLIADLDLSNADKLTAMKVNLTDGMAEKFDNAYNAGVSIGDIALYYAIRQREDDEGHKLSKDERKKAAFDEGIKPAAFATLEKIFSEKSK